MFKLVLFSMIIFIVVISLLLTYYGAFQKVSIAKSSFDECWFVYKTCTGPYQKTATVSDAIYYDLLNNRNIETFRGMAVYYDNPKEVTPQQCRSAVGCIVEKPSESLIEILKEQYGVLKIERREAFRATFPYKGRFSIILGVLRVYPAVHSFAKDNNISTTPIIEICDVPEKRLDYYTGFSPVMNFFVHLQTAMP